MDKKYTFGTHHKLFKDSNGIIIHMEYVLDHEGDTSPSISSGYLPVKANGEVMGHSGVTLYGGIDIGQLPKGRKDILMSYGMSSEQADYYLPFMGIKGNDAKILWNCRGNKEYRLPQDVLDHVYGVSVSKRAIQLFNIFGKEFSKLLPHRQTAVFDIYHQFGIYGAPSFTKAIKRGLLDNDWTDAGKELANFGAEKYQKRIDRNLAMFAGFELPPYKNSGIEIKDMQKELNLKLKNNRIREDGAFGQNTRDAIALYIAKS